VRCQATTKLSSIRRAFNLIKLRFNYERKKLDRYSDKQEEKEAEAEEALLVECASLQKDSSINLNLLSFICVRSQFDRLADLARLAFGSAASIHRNHAATRQRQVCRLLLLSLSLSH
jgi:hypothetical protein